MNCECGHLDTDHDPEGVCWGPKLPAPGSCDQGCRSYTPADPTCACGQFLSQHTENGACNSCLCPEFHTETRWVTTDVNGRGWPLILPSHRAFRREWLTGWEADRLDHMRTLLEPGMVVYDIGAEEGDMPALWASWGCEVVLVEPGPAVWANMREVFTHNNLPEPLGCFEGFAAAVDVPDPPRLRDGWPSSAFGPITTGHGFSNLCERPDFAKVKIDTLAAWFGAPDVLTIDVEGSEYEVLVGAEEHLRCENPPLVWVAVHPEFMHRMYQRTASDLNALLMDCGYEGRLLQDSHEEHWFYWRPDVHKVDA